jgi:NAD(P)H-hydrate epimerase
MIPLLGRDALRAIDRDAAERLGLPTLLLMENAGRGAFEVIAAAYPRALDRVVIVGGVGQNGGDGWVLARHLWNAGKLPRVLLAGDRARVAGDARVNLDALERLGVQCTSIGQDLSPLVHALSEATLVVDALFGTGLDRPLTGVNAAVVERINACAADVVALDLPSGVDADRGCVLGSAVRAQRTVTFAAHKRGLHQYPGVALAGEIACVSIGVPAGYDADGLIEAGDIARWIARRAPDAHKGSAGHVLVIAGAPGRTGAALLAGLGALRGGAGLVTLAARAAARAALDAKVLELMTAELPESPARGLAAALELAAGKRAVVIGPGFGLDAYGREVSLGLATALEMSAVLDADALTSLGSELGLLRSARGPRVLTPHPGEAARLLDTDTDDVQADRYGAAQRLAERSGAVVVLKGARTIIAEPGGRMRVCARGTPAMAVAGTGDVLSGVVGALLAQPAIDAFDAASAAVYVHARAGERAARADRGLFAGELAAALPAALAECLDEARETIA